MPTTVANSLYLTELCVVEAGRTLAEAIDEAIDKLRELVRRAAEIGPDALVNDLPQRTVLNLLSEASVALRSGFAQTARNFLQRAGLRLLG